MSKRPGAERLPASPAAGARAAIGDRRRAAIRRIDDQRREAERARAQLVAQERWSSPRAVLPCSVTRRARGTGLAAATPACRALAADHAEFRAFRPCCGCRRWPGRPTTCAELSNLDSSRARSAARRGYGARRVLRNLPAVGGRAAWPPWPPPTTTASFAGTPAAVLFLPA